MVNFDKLLASMYMHLPRPTREALLKEICEDKFLAGLHGFKYPSYDCYHILKERLEGIIGNELFVKPKYCKPALVGYDVYCLEWTTMDRKNEHCFYQNTDRLIYLKNKKIPLIGCDYNLKKILKYKRSKQSKRKP